MTPAEFKTAYPEFAATDDTAIQRQLDNFALLYRGDYGDVADYLTGLYVAHQVTVFTLKSSKSAVQNVKSRSVDGMSWTYADNPQSAKAGDFASTKYGLEFHRIMSLFGKGPIMAKAAQ